MATYFRKSFPKSQMMYHWLLAGTTAKLSTLRVQVRLLPFGLAGSKGSAIESSRMSSAEFGGVASPAGSWTRLVPGTLHDVTASIGTGVTSSHIGPSPAELTAETLKK